MAFSNITVETCFNNAGGKCECTRSSPNHPWVKCGTRLVWENRNRSGKGAWETHHKDGNTDNDYLSNCEILCWDCHSRTL